MLTPTADITTPPRICDRRVIACGAVITFLLMFLVYGEVGSHQFVNYDDPEYILENPAVRSGLSVEGVRWAFTTFHAANYHPLTWMSHMLDASLFGVELGHAGPHKFHNVALHITATWCLLLALHAMTGSPWRSVLVAALFALHPLRVQSVAWASERKDVLSVALGMGAILAYAWHARSPSVRRLSLVFVVYTMSLLAKPMFVTLPFVMLLLDFWPLGRHVTGDPGEPLAARLRRLVGEKIPFLALAAASCVVTYFAQQQGGAVQSIEKLPIAGRLANAAVSYVRYLGMTFWPVELSFFYRLRDWSAWQIALSTFLLAALTACAVVLRKRRPAMLVGWLVFVGTFVPVIGLVQVGAQSIADRYTYLPHVGLFIAIVWAIPWSAKWGPAVRMVGIAVISLVVLTICVVSRWQVSFWRSDLSLFARAVAIETDSSFAHLNYAGSLVLANRPADALPHAKAAVTLSPSNVRAYVTLGRTQKALGDTAAAETTLRQAITLDPNHADVRHQLANVLIDAGRWSEAIVELGKAVELVPDSPVLTPKYLVGLGLALAQHGNPREAVTCFRRASELAPDNADALANLAVTMDQLNETTKAIPFMERAVRIAPSVAGHRENLAAMYFRVNEPDKAIVMFESILPLNPTTLDEARVRHALGTLLPPRGRVDEALPHLLKATHLDPNNANYSADLGIFYFKTRRIEEAAAAFREAIRIKPDHPDAVRGLRAITSMKQPPPSSQPASP